MEPTRTNNTARRALAAKCQQLLDLNAILFEAGIPEAAYHALEAATHCAAAINDAPLLREIAGRASEQELRAADTVDTFPSGLQGQKRSPAERARWESLERLFAAAERAASVKASTIEFRRADHGAGANSDNNPSPETSTRALGEG